MKISSALLALVTLLSGLTLTASAELLVYYPFNTNNGTTADNEGTLSDGTIKGAGTYGPGKDATFGTAFQGNRAGANDAFVETNFTGNELGFGSGGVYTAMAWINWAGVSGSSNDHMVFGQLDGDGNNAQLHHGIRSEGGDPNSNNIHFGGWGGAQDIGDAGTVPPNTWTHVAWQYDGTEKVVYVNGIESARSAGNNITNPALEVIIGGHGRDTGAGVPAQSFHGSIDEVKIFNEVLTATQIQAEMTPGATSLDSDSDGLSDDDENNIHGTDPNDPDSDDDGINDGDEVAHGLDPNSNTGDDGASGDPDGDSVTNIDEINTIGTDPKDSDSDDDSLNDGDEITAGSNPLEPDSDGDTLTDGAEVHIHNTDPTDKDSDNDGYDDHLEISAGTDPNDQLDFPTTPPGDGPLIYYSFNEQNGTMVENLGSLLTPGVLNGGASYAPGKDDSFGTAFAGNRLGANDGVILTGFAGTDLGMTDNSTSYTAMAWVYWNGSAGSADHMIFGQDDENPGGNGAQLHHGIRDDSGNNVHFGGWGRDINDAGAIPAGEWTHVAWQYDGTGAGEGSVYVNGLETARSVLDNITNPSLDVIIGGHTRDGDPFQSFNGLIDEVKIYDRPLSPEEIQLAMSPIPIGPNIVSFSPTAPIIPTGSPLTLSWTIDADLTSLSIDQGIGDVLGLTTNGIGQIVLDPGPLANTTYTLTATNEDGITTSEISVGVSDLPIIEFFNSSETIVAPDSPVQLNWNVVNAESLSINGTDVTGTNSLDVAPSETTTWTLSATNAEGTSSRDVTVTVVIPGEPAISEVSAANGTLLTDEDGDTSDWIEIYNPSGTTAILNGYYLTDDPGDLRKWRIPDMILPAGEFLIVFASDKNRAVAGAELHSNFSLRSSGEYLALTKEDGGATQILTEFDPLPRQFDDITYGVFPDGLTNGYFANPTPGAANNTGVVDYVRDTTFSAKRGFYDTPFAVTISSNTEGAEIRYTTDGSAPTIATGTLYTGPVDISTTTTLRAIAYKPGLLSTNVDTQTYIFLDDLVQQPTNPAGFPASWNGTTADYQMDPDVVNNPLYSTSIKDDLKAIPTMSIVMRTEDMFGSSGLYANPNNSGSQWERAGSVELLSADGEKDMQVNCAVRMQGGVGRRPQFLKHSFRLLFKRDYGPTKLEYPLFEDATQDAEGAVESFDSIILRAGFNNTWHRQNSGEERRAQYLRDQFMHDSQLAMGHASCHGTFVHLYLNGLYWGIYNVVERPNADFGSSYYGGDKDDWDALNSYPRNVVDGTASDWLTAHSIANNGVADQTGYDAISEYVDIPNLIDYMLVNFYGGNRDWDDHNWYSINPRVDGGGYKFVNWDAERTLESVSGDNRTGVNQSNKPSRLYAQLRANPEFRLQFADHARKHLFNGGALTPELTAERYQRLSTFVDRAIVGESARWGDSQRSSPYTRNNEWVTERNRLFDSYFPNRTNVLLGQLRSADLYPDTDAPTFSQHGGHLSAGTNVTISGPDGVIYFTTDGSDPRLPGGAVNPAALPYNNQDLFAGLSGAVNLRARALDGGEWSAINEALFIVDSAVASSDNLVISELHYRPLPPTEEELAAGFNERSNFEFVELMNISGSPIDLTNVRFTTGITFDFDDSELGFLLGPGERILLVNNRPAFEMRYPSIPGSSIAGTFSGNLSNDGEQIVLLADDDSIIRNFIYNDQPPWPESSDGDGFSLTLIKPESNPIHADPFNWRSSVSLGGSPIQSDAVEFAGDPTDSEALMNYLLGDSGSLGGEVRSLIIDDVSGDYFTFSATLALASDDVSFIVETSTDLENWQTNNTLFSRVNNGNGTATFIFRSLNPVTVDQRRYMRLRILSR